MSPTIDRRAFLLGAGALLAAGRAAAQAPGRGYRVGVLWSSGALASPDYRSAFVSQLASHGFVEGRNLRVDSRSALDWSADVQSVKELVALKADAIVALTTSVTLAAQAATKTVPIVFAWVADPVLSGIVKDYARPGGNTTGVTNRFFELTIKRIELLRELMPSAKRIAAVGFLGFPLFQAGMPRVRNAARQFGFELIETDVGGPFWTPAIESAIKAGAEAVLPIIGFAVAGQRTSGEQVVQLALQKRVPMVFADAEMVELGGLMSYGTHPGNDLRRAADLVAKVLDGRNPSELPVDQASRFELVLNLKTARAIGLTIPQSILLRADRVIE